MTKAVDLNTDYPQYNTHNVSNALWFLVHKAEKWYAETEMKMQIDNCNNVVSTEKSHLVHDDIIIRNTIFEKFLLDVGSSITKGKFFISRLWSCWLNVILFSLLSGRNFSITACFAGSYIPQFAVVEYTVGKFGKNSSCQLHWFFPIKLRLSGFKEQLLAKVTHGYLFSFFGTPTCTTCCFGGYRQCLQPNAGQSIWDNLLEIHATPFLSIVHFNFFIFWADAPRTNKLNILTVTLAFAPSW